MPNINKYNMAFLSAPIIIILIGSIVIFGWYTNNTSLVQILPEFAPMQYNTALCFCLIGMSMLFAVFQFTKTSIILSSLVIFIGGATLLQYIFSFNTGLDQLFIEHYIDIKTSHPGRMAPNTAICFILTGLSHIFCVYISTKKLHKFTYFAMLTGSLTFILSGFAFLGYLANVPNTYGWGAYTNMAVHTSLGFIFWSFGYIYWFKLINKSQINHSNVLSAVFIFVVVTFAFLSLSQILAKKEISHIHDSKIMLQTQLNNNIKDTVKLKLQALKRITLRLSAQDKISKSIWDLNTKSYLANFNSIYAMGLLNNKFEKEWLEQDRDGLEKIIIPDLISLGLNDRVMSLQLSAPVTIKIYDEVEKGAWVIVPFKVKNKTNYLVALLSYTKVVSSMIPNSTTNYYDVSISSEGVQLYGNQNNKNDFERLYHLEKENIIYIYNKKLDISLTPTQLLLSKYESIIPTAILALGLFITFFIYLFVCLSIYLYNKAFKLELLIKSTKAISESNSINEAIKSCLKDICCSIKWDLGHAYKISDDAPNLLVPMNIWYLNHTDKYEDFRTITENTSFKLGEGLPGRVLLTGMSAWINDVNHDDNFPRAKKCSDLNIISAIGIPVIYNNRVILVLEFFSCKKREYDRDFMNSVSILSDAISNAYGKKEAEDLLNKKNIELEKSNKEMESLAYRDPLTQLLNRRSFEQEAQGIMSYTKRHKIKTAILYSDIDDFKKINDQYGHSTGDILIEQIAARLKDAVRKEDLVSRFGGDEFVVFLTNIKSNEDAKDIADKILTNISQRFFINGFSFNISMSIGISLTSMYGTLENALKSADKALYKSKKSGKSKHCTNHE